MFPAAACSLGVNTGKDCKVEDKEAGYVFDLTPLATKTWVNDDFYTVKSTSQYNFQLKVRTLLMHCIHLLTLSDKNLIKASSQQDKTKW